jgi:hypothetical protein
MEDPARTSPLRALPKRSGLSRFVRWTIAIPLVAVIGMLVEKADVANTLRMMAPDRIIELYRAAFFTEPGQTQAADGEPLAFPLAG